MIDKAPQSEILYPHDALMSPGPALLAALQQVIAMFIGCMTPALIFISAVQLDPATKNYLISMSLLSAGLGTFLQARRFGWIGSGLLSVNGTSFAYLDLLLRAGSEGGLALACGMALAAVPLQFVLAFFLPSLR
ncbi:MAG: solute carrier family 23 protein, partial [Verrucomicrobiota bacterium]|nr:solute carrier family 23 protein [Verrucomicrobiota bacterium]